MWVATAPIQSCRVSIFLYSATLEELSQNSRIRRNLKYTETKEIMF